MDNGAENEILLKLSKEFVKLDGEGYCFLICAYNLHPTMTRADVDFLAAKHTLEASCRLYTIVPTDLLRYMHDHFKDYHFKCILCPGNERSKSNSRDIAKQINKCVVDEGKIILELQGIHTLSTPSLDIRHCVAYDASRNMVVEPSKQGGQSVIKNVDNYPMILETLGYTDIYEIVGIYKLVPKLPRLSRWAS